jgi:hypothetical protein
MTHEVTFRPGDVVARWYGSLHCDLATVQHADMDYVNVVHRRMGEMVAAWWDVWGTVLARRNASPPKPKRGHIPMEHGPCA